MAVNRLKDYGSEGLLGVLTPQANTTVEPEFWSLLPPGWSLLNARLTSSHGSIEERLVDYAGQFAKTADRFANSPVECIAAACTGTSYLIGAEREAQIVAEMEDSLGFPFWTAARASTAALRAMSASRIALLTPYPDSLNVASTRYWEEQGFTVIAKTGPALEEEAFHPIYAMAGGGVLAAYERLSQEDADAILMLGTGMATLAPLLAGQKRGLRPAISCNVALAWAATNHAIDPRTRDATLPHWIAGKHWAKRLRLLFPGASLTA